MSNWIVDPRDRVAWANVSGATGTFINAAKASGFATIARTGGQATGDYTLTLVDAVDPEDAMIIALPFGANPPAGGVPSPFFTPIDNSSFRARWQVGVTLTDVNFRIIVFRTIVNR